MHSLAHAASNLYTVADDAVVDAAAAAASTSTGGNGPVDQLANLFEKMLEVGS